MGREAQVNHLLSSNELSGTVNEVLLRGSSTGALVVGLEPIDAGLKVDRDLIRVSAMEVLNTKRGRALQRRRPNRPPLLHGLWGRRPGISMVPRVGTEEGWGMVVSSMSVEQPQVSTKLTGVYAGALVGEGKDRVVVGLGWVVKVVRCV